MHQPLKIIHYPDPRLRMVSQPVTQFDENLKKLTEEMFHLMRDDQGVGLAAPQVGINLRLFVMNHSGKPEDDVVVVNPELVDADGNALGEEGCLSLPRIRSNIDRATKITLKAQDLEGNHWEETATDFKARIWQHEFDHLNGVMIIDRMGFTARMGIRKKLKEMEEDYAIACKKKK